MPKNPIAFIALAALLLMGMSSCLTAPKVLSMPAFTPAGATYYLPVEVTISASIWEESTIHYTMDGSYPNSSSAVYSGPIYIAETTTLKAVACKDGWMDSVAATAVYTITIEPAQMIYVHGGTFTMGRTTGSGESDELPAHSVSLSPFHIGKYEVTQAEWKALMLSIPYQNSGINDNFPVCNVSWYSILKYCNLRSLAEGLAPVYSISGSTNPAYWGSVPTSNNATWNAAICKWSANGYRLPTEAEWEYAARGATNDPDYLYSGSDDINAVAWYKGNAGSALPGSDTNPDYGVHPVGTKAPNGLGICDMSGNALEWCWDWYGYEYYSISPGSDPTGPSNGSYRLLRGGVWYNNASICRVAKRHAHNSYINNPFSDGFRLCRSTD